MTERTSQQRAFDAGVRQWLATFGSVNTSAAYGRDLRVFETWMVRVGVEPLHASAEHMMRFRRSCEADGASAATVNRRLAAVTSFFRFMGHADAVNPAAATTRATDAEPTATQRLDDAALAAVLGAAVTVGPRAVVLIDLLLLGFKLGEIVALDVDDVIARRRRGVAVTVDVQRASGRVAELDGRTAKALLGCVGERRTGAVLVGNSPSREPARLTRFGADYLVKRTGEAAELATPLTANALRATFMARAHESGRSLEDVSHAAGHASTRTTLRFVPR